MLRRAMSGDVMVGGWRPWYDLHPFDLEWAIGLFINAGAADKEG